MKSCYYITLFVIQLNFTFQANERETIYVLPDTLASTYIREPCITLSELARSSNVITAKQSMTLVFMPGYHTLDLDICIFNTIELLLISSGTYLSSQASITCQYNSGFTFESSGHVVIANLTFIGCGNKILSCDQLTVESSTFIGRNGSGTALEVVKTSAYIVNSSFISNRGGSYRGPIKEPFNPSVSMFAFVGGALISNQSDIVIINSLFERNYAEVGGAIFSTMASNITIINSVLESNNVDKYGNCSHFKGCGGVIFINNSILTTNLSKFCDSMATIAGVVMAYDYSTVTIDYCEFRNNTAPLGYIPQNLHSAGVIATYASIVSISRSLFESNKARVGGVVAILGPPSIVTIVHSKFKNNHAVFGGAISLSSKGSRITIIKSHFDMNVGDTQGGVLDSSAPSNVTFIECIFSNNRANVFTGGAICMANTKSMTIKGSQFINNSAINYVGGAINLVGAHLTLYNTSLIANKAHDGGALYLSEKSFVDFYNVCSLANNTANHSGGAIYAFDSILQVYGNLEITSNTANDSGGGAMLSHCEIFCQSTSTLLITKNIALKDGGGIYTSNSYIIVLFDRSSQQHSAVNFTENAAYRWGGGIFLLMASSVHIEKVGNYKKVPTQADNILYFTSNSADCGGAIYVADETNYGMCSTFSTASDCFIQILSPEDTECNIYDIVSVNFENNKAGSSGSILFGGLLDRCILRHDSEILRRMGYFINNPVYSVPQVNGFTYFQNISNIGHDDNLDTPHIISSLPVRVCFCQLDNKPNCSYKPDMLRIKKGERFNISLVTVDQINHTLGDTIIYSSLHYAESGLGDGQVIQTVKNYCTPLNFTIHSQHDNETLIFYAEGPCRNASKSLSMIKVKFINCTCPIGFQVKVSEKANCVCECDSRLLQLCITGCNAGNQTVLRKGICWISLLNDSHYHREYLTYSYCPSDYCNSNPQINLNTINGSDVQCANHRSGILCGLCKPDHSLSLGSSRCIPCSGTWPVNFAIILFAALVSGIALVAIIMILNLTVAIGTLNGLIFYANIIDSSKSVFYIPSCKVYSVLISWLNLDIGFDVCFYKGLDTYWKTWLQLVFPIYVISLVIMIIILSRCSMKFSMLIAKKNPVATLATLILFSYTKLLHTVIVVLSKANLQYSDHPSKLSVWLFDPTVKYDTGKHIPLFIVAVLILIVGVTYTFLLLSWQWLLKCVRYQKLCHFFDPYHAPYRFKHRYWTGLLLLARVAIYILIILYGHGNPNINLLVIIFLVSFLLFLKGHIVHHIYKDWKIDVIETICYLNIVLFSVVKIIVLNTSNQRIYHDITTNISGLITLLLLAYVLICQFLSEVCGQCWTRMRQRLRDRKRTDTDINSHNENITTDNRRIEDLQSQAKPTSSVIEGQPIHKTPPLNKINDASAVSVELDDDNDGDNASFVSADSVAPLLGR